MIEYGIKRGLPLGGGYCTLTLNGYSSSGMSGDMQWVNFSQPLWEAALLMEVGLKSTVSMAT